MARPLRIQYPGAVYHVMNRGGSRQRVFLDKQNGRQGPVLGDEEFRNGLMEKPLLLIGNTPATSGLR
ncbi:MAG: hypothetical protein ACREQV_03760 [Candidatus Binatia bacterium]